MISDINHLSGAEEFKTNDYYIREDNENYGKI